MIKRLKQKIKRFLNSSIDSKLDKILMLEANILSNNNMQYFRNRGGAAGRFHI